MFGLDVTLLPISWNIPLLFLLYVVLTRSQSRNKSDDIPFVVWSRWPLPRLVLNWVFALKSRSLLDAGYQQFRDKPFRLRQADKDIIVLPVSYLDELCALPSAVASPSAALDLDLLGSYTHSNLILETRIHHFILQRKFAPRRLGTIIPRLQKQMNVWFDESFGPVVSDSDKWVEIAPYEIFGRLLSRLSAQAIVGPEFANDEVWLQSTWNYTESLFKTCTLLRLLPPWARPIFCHALPSYREGKRCLNRAKSLLTPRIRELLQSNDAVERAPPRDGDDNDGDYNMMRWLIDLAKGKDRNEDTIAHIQVLLSFASVHTTLLRVLNIVYDLAARPDLVAELEKEIAVCLSWSSSNNEGDTTTTARAAGAGHDGVAFYEQLQKLDSVMRESQRFSPPTMVGVKRLFLAPHQFRGEGQLRVPRGAYVCLPVVAIETDPDVYTDPLTFDGLRHYYDNDAHRNEGHNDGDIDNELEAKERKQDKATARKQKHFATTGPDFLSFGHGKHACPGRHFASLTIKTVLVKLLTSYEFKFPLGQEGDDKMRPQHLSFQEFGLTDPGQKILVRRKKAECWSGVHPK